MNAEEKLKKAVKLLKQAANPEQIILFGSRARNSFHKESDFDLMIIEKNVASKNKETVRLLRIISPTIINVDLIVVSLETFNYWKDTINTVYYDAATEGKILYDKAS